VRRISAIVLLAMFSFSLIASAALNTSESNLPECCRKGGKHKCVMSTDARDSPGMRSMAEKCPSPPGRGETLVPGAEPVRQSVAVVAVTSHPAGIVQTEARYRASFSRTRQKRGPPSLLS
jgi:hypothetical protein